MERHPIESVYIFFPYRNKDETLHGLLNLPYLFPEEGYCRRFETIMVPLICQ